MSIYIIRRLLLALVMLLIVTIMVFLAMRLLPGDPVLLILTRGEASKISEEDIQNLRHEFGLDKPLPVQYITWVSNAFRGDLGISITQRVPVTQELARRFPVTLHLSLLALLLSVVIGIPAGIICAVRRGTWIDMVVTVLANLGITVPAFWLGILLIYLFAMDLRWLPVFGYTSPFVDFGQSTKQIIMPVFCLSIFSLASITRQTRSSMLEVMRQDYIRTAWAKGLQERSLIFRHALKNGLIPVITLLGVSLSHVLGGSVLIETVFQIPGIGRMVVNGVFGQDYAIVQGVIFVIAIAILLINLAVDISYAWLDPRIRFS
jgi:peptide/nickel transport system permease protein